MDLERETTDHLLRELLSAVRDSQIIQLAAEGVSQHDIRDIVGVDMHRVNRIARRLRKARKGSS
jgi:transposase-like protein